MDKKCDLLDDIEAEEFNFDNFCLMYYRGLEYANRLLQGDIDLRKVQLDSEPMAEGSVVLLEGWIPEDVEPEVRRMLDESGVYYDIRPATKEDRAPIKLKNNAFARMFEVLTKMYGMPNYSEFGYCHHRIRRRAGYVLRCQPLRCRPARMDEGIHDSRQDRGHDV